MATLHQVDPESFVNVAERVPANGRGAWTREGIGFDYRYRLAARVRDRIGRNAEKSLAHWAVAAGCFAIQKRLVATGFLEEIKEDWRGIYNVPTRDAVKRFQEANKDPDGGAQLVVDGIVGRSDARALFTPVVRYYERKFAIPKGLVLGQTNHESAMDPGAVGYYIFYVDEQSGDVDYRGVDRALSQINSKAHSDITWMDAFSPSFALAYSANRMRGAFDGYRVRFPDRSEDVLWDAAVCAHNSPLYGRQWAETGAAPNAHAANYVNAVKTAIY